MLLNRLNLLERRLKTGTDPKKAGLGTGNTLYVVSKRSVHPEPVYNITVDGANTYFAGPALVHNCDAAQYLCLHADGGGIFGGNAGSQKREIKQVPYAWM